MVDDYLHRATFIQPAELDGLFGSPFTSLFSFADGDAERTEAMIARGMSSVLTLPKIKLRFWRPLTVATHWIDYALWPNSAWLMHLHSLLWFGAAVLTVALLYRRLMGPTLVAGIACLLFAIDDAHSLPVGWIANRNSLIALVLGVSAIIQHDRWRRDQITHALPFAVLLFSLALLAKESSVSVCAYLFSYALFIDKSPRLQRAATLAPYAVCVLIWRFYYQWAGYGASGSTSYIDPISSPLAYLRELPVRVPLLLNGQFGFPPSDFYTFLPPPITTFLVAWAVVLVTLMLPLFVSLLRKDSMAKFWALGMSLSLLPICATGPMDRLLDFTSIGAMALLSLLLVHLRHLVHADPPEPHQRYYRYGYRVLLTIHFILAPIYFIGMPHLFAFGSGIVIEEVDGFVPKDESISERTVVLVNMGNYPIGLYLPIQRALAGIPAPAAVRSLSAPSISLLPMSIERRNETTLRVHAEYGPSLFRGIQPMKIGDRVNLPDTAVEVIDTDADGWPSVLDFHFVVPLENPSLIWLEFQGVEAKSWIPPEVGETVFLNDL